MYGSADIEKLYNENVPPVEKAVLGFPRRLLSVEGKLSEVIKRWSEIAPQGIFEKADLSEMETLALLCEEQTDEKELIYYLCTIPVDSRNPRLLALFENWMVRVVSGEGLNPSACIPVEISYDKYPLEELELKYKEFDLLHNFVRRFGNISDLPGIVSRKRQISDRIAEILSGQRFSPKACRKCGRRLAWDYPYGICDVCYNMNVYGGLWNGKW